MQALTFLALLNGFVFKVKRVQLQLLKYVFCTHLLDHGIINTLENLHFLHARKYDFRIFQFLVLS